MKPKLVPDWRQAWRWFSVQSMALAGAVQATWVMIPEDMREAVPGAWVAGITAGILVLGVIGRLIDQSKPEERP
jgi:hypothetical protein